MNLELIHMNLMIISFDIATTRSLKDENSENAKMGKIYYFGE